MSDDWAKKYVESYNQEQQRKRQKEEEDRTRRRLAENGAREKFYQIRERIKLDTQILRGAVTFQFVELGEFPEEKFAVIYRGDPAVELSVELNVTTIICEYMFSPKEDGRDRHQSKTLRICSDLDGQITVSENGRGKPFAYDSEVSEFLLMPLLNHITAQ